MAHARAARSADANVGSTAIERFQREGMSAMAGRVTGVFGRMFAACHRLDRRMDLWITVGVLLGYLILDSIPLAAAIGVGIWLAMRGRTSRR